MEQDVTPLRRGLAESMSYGGVTGQLCHRRHRMEQDVTPLRRGLAESMSYGGVTGQELEDRMAPA